MRAKAYGVSPHRCALKIKSHLKPIDQAFCGRDFIKSAAGQGNLINRRAEWGFKATSWENDPTRGGRRARSPDVRLQKLPRRFQSWDRKRSVHYWLRKTGSKHSDLLILLWNFTATFRKDCFSHVLCMQAVLFKRAQNKTFCWMMVLCTSSTKYNLVDFIINCMKCKYFPGIHTFEPKKIWVLLREPLR